MTLSFVLFLFLAHLGIGIVFTLLLVNREAGVKFFRFNAGLAGTLLLVALAFRPDEVILSSDAQGLAFLAVIVVAAASLLYWATIGRVAYALRTILLSTAVAAGGIALVAQALAISAGASTLAAALTVASFATSSALLGGSCTAMSLGHWYLVLPKMPVAHLKLVVKFHIGSTAARILVVSAAVWWAIVVAELPEPGFDRYIFSIDGVFFWQRILFGLLGPAVLAYMTWETAKIQATQSATGILYVDFFTVMVGEVLAKYLLLATTVPV
ncbi:MAG: hypothetical protein QF681_05555 [Vicinamibacterales bacterium]|jgi:hypothetical protein|nr:hypothetical protein [Vicinamibacterales bacterium]